MDEKAAPPAEVVKVSGAARLRDSTGLSAEDPLRAVVSRRVPALGEAVDANVGAGMRRVDEVSASDVDPDVVEPVEEDEITGLKLVLRNRHGGRVVPLSDGVVRQRDAELAEHVLDETRAVEAARSCPGPYVWDTEVLQRHRDHAAVAPAGGSESQGARDERRVARLLLQLAEPSVGGVQAPLEPFCARLRRVSADSEEDGALVRRKLRREKWGGGRREEEPMLGVRELPGLRARRGELGLRPCDLLARRVELRLEVDREDAASREAPAAAAVEGGEPEHLAHVRVGVVVAVDRPRDVELAPAAHEVARGAEDRVRRIVWVGDTVPVRVDAPARPGRGHELHPADGAGRAWPEVLAEIRLHLVDGAEHRPRDGVGVAGRLPDGA